MTNTRTVLLTPKEAAARLRLSQSTLAKWRMTGSRQIPFVKLGAKILYSEQAIEDFIAKRSYASTSDLGAEAA